MFTVYHSPTHLFFFCPNFPFSALYQLEQLSHLQQSPFPLKFPLPLVVIATDATPTHWGLLFFRALVCHCQLVDAGLVLL